MAASRAKLLEMALLDKGRMMLEESKNKVESYIYKIKNKLVDDEEAISQVSSKKQREECQKLAENAEEWLDEDGYTADLPTMEAKYAELSVPFDMILFRLVETTALPEAIEKMQKKLTDVEALVKKWETSMPQVTEDERKDVLKKVEDARKWIEKKEKGQSKKKSHEDPAFTSEEIPVQIKPIESLVVRLSKKPKPKPEKKKKVDTENATKTESNETDTENATKTESGEAASEEKNETAEAKETVETDVKGDEEKAELAEDEL
jgi:hypoxia up-regulated 1